MGNWKRNSPLKLVRKTGLILLSLHLAAEVEVLAASAKKTQKSPAHEEKSALREIYSAMEPEPGPGNKGIQKQTLKQLDSFEPVPSAQREPITRRLKLIERLIREHGRAYDFRTITIAELTAILHHLEHPSKSRAVSTPAQDSDEMHPSSAASQGEPEPPEPPKKKIHLPELNQSRPEAPPEDSETEESSDAGTATIHSNH
jgi:hypothetical protein